MDRKKELEVLNQYMESKNNSVKFGLDYAIKELKTIKNITEQLETYLKSILNEM